MDRRFFTTIILGDASLDVLVSYNRDAGYKGDSIDPPEAPSFEISAIAPRDGKTVIPQQFYYDENLLAECERHHASAAAHRYRDRD